MFKAATDAIDNLFFIGVQEAYDTSIKILLKEFSVPLQTEIKKERDQQSSKQMKKQKAKIKDDKLLIDRVKQVNEYDMKLYKYGKYHLFCPLNMFTVLDYKQILIFGEYFLQTIIFGIMI